MQEPSISDFPVRHWPRKTAQAMVVVLTAKHRAKRDRRPSLSYGNELNPRKAVKLAISDLGTYKPNVGEDYLEMAERLAFIANTTGQPCIGDLTGCAKICGHVTVLPNETVSVIKERVTDQLNRYWRRRGVTV